MKFSDFLREQKEQHAVMAFGRMNPITTGHEQLVNKVKSIAQKVGGTHHIIVSHSQDAKKNPLSAAQKLQHARRAFPNTNFQASDREHPNFLAQAAKLHKAGVTHLHMVGGSDRVDEFKKTLNKYNGTHEGALFNFKKITVHSAGQRDPDAEGTTGMSASKMRGHAEKGDFESFRKGVPSSMSDAHAKEMYRHVRKGMGLNEDIDEDFEMLITEGVHDQSIFKAVFLAGGPGSGKDYVLSNTLDGQGLTEINSDKALEFLMDKEGLDKTMPASEKEKRDFVRNKAKNMTELRQKLALLGRNGLIINGTGDDLAKIQKIKSGLEKIGYETMMIMVNTNDEVSAARNVERGQRGGRTVPEDIRRKKWEDAQNARPELAKLFGDKYMEYDNSEDLRQATPEVVKAKKEEMLQLFKNVQEFVKTPPGSDESQQWVADEMQKKDTLPVDKQGHELTPHGSSQAAEQAKRLGLQYYGFGRYGRNGTVTHRAVHDRLVEVRADAEIKEDIDNEFEELLDEDLRQWFDPKHPKGGWKRINSKGEAIGPCAREPGEPKPKCMSNEKRAKLSKKERASAVASKRKHDPNPERKGAPINVSNFGKGKLSESYELSDSSALNVLLLGTKIEEYDLGEEKKEMKLLKDKLGKVRTFMLRSAAAREAHTNGGTVMPYKNGYVIKLNEENENVELSKKSAGLWLKEQRETSAGWSNQSSSGKGLITEGVTELIPGAEYAKGSGIEAAPTGTQETGTRTKITLNQIRQRKKETQSESIDKGIEPGLSMSASGENLVRPGLKTKQNKKPFEEAIGSDGSIATSISDKKEDELKKVGINLQSFKAKRPI